MLTLATLFKNTLFLCCVDSNAYRHRIAVDTCLTTSLVTQQNKRLCQRPALIFCTESEITYVNAFNGASKSIPAGTARCRYNSHLNYF